MNYFARMRDEFRLFSAMFNGLPSHPYSPFYARWETVLHLRLDLHRQQAQEAQQARELGVVATWKGWVLVDSSKCRSDKA
jgi:hypothetical protein